MAPPEEIACGAEPADPAELDAQGFRSVLDLRPRPDGDDLPAALRARGIRYRSVPVELNGDLERAVGEVRLQLHLLEKPVYMHCWSGETAQLVALIDAAIRERLSGADAVRRAEQQGLRLSQAVTEALRAYVDRFFKEGL